MSAGYFSPRTKETLDDLYAGLVTANHILHHHNLLDGYGHISVRNPDSVDSFLMAHSLAPALVSSADDIGEYRFEDGEPVGVGTKDGFVERFIHSELYKKFPGVNCVVHSHAGEVLPFAVAGVPLRPVVHMAGFLDSAAPVWDAASHYSSLPTSHDPHDLLVRTPALGASLAASFAKPNTSAGFIYSKLSSTITGAKAAPESTPEHPVVLMRGHGFSVAAAGIEEAVCMAVYTREAAKAQMAAMTLSGAFFGGKVEGKVDIEGGGKIKSGTLERTHEVHCLTAKEAHDAWESIQKTVGRPWGLWCREVERNPLYVNECRKAAGG